MQLATPVATPEGGAAFRSIHTARVSRMFPDNHNAIRSALALFFQSPLLSQTAALTFHLARLYIYASTGRSVKTFTMPSGLRVGVPWNVPELFLIGFRCCGPLARPLPSSPPAPPVCACCVFMCVCARVCNSSQITYGFSCKAEMGRSVKWIPIVIYKVEDLGFTW